MFFFRKLSRWRLLFCFQSVHFASTFCSKCPSFHSMLASLAQNTLKICRALRAPRFILNFSQKVPFCGFWSDDTRIKKLFLLFFPLPCLVSARAARRNFRFFPGIFRLKRSQSEDRATQRLLKIINFLKWEFFEHQNTVATAKKKHWFGAL